MEQKDENVNCFRRCKRRVRRSIGWSQLPMRYQMRTHLFLLFGIYFILYFIFLYVYTNQIYVKYLFEQVSKRYDDIVFKRFIDGATAFSTVVYLTEKIGIDTVLRLTDVFSRINTEVQHGYYIGNNLSIQNYKLFHQADLNNTDSQGMTCLYTNANIDYSKDPAGATVDVQTIRVMNRYWTEAVNINIGND